MVSEVRAGTDAVSSRLYVIGVGEVHEGGVFEVVVAVVAGGVGGVVGFVKVGWMRGEYIV